MQEPMRSISAAGTHGGSVTFDTDISDSRRSKSLHVQSRPIWIKGQKYWHQTFPTEPSWWNDERNTRQREAAIAEFKWSELDILVVELKAMVQPSLSSSLDGAQLVRRCLSLSWVAEVAFEHLNGASGLEGIEYMCRYHQVNAAKYLAMEGWRTLLDLSALMVADAICEAVARPDELAIDSQKLHS